VLDDPLGDLRTDALDESGAEIAAYALDGGGQDGRVVLGHELLAVLRMGAPTPLQAQRLTGLGAEQRADDGEQIPGAPTGVDAGHRVTGLLIGIRDPLEHPFDDCQARCLCRCLSRCLCLTLVGHAPKVAKGSDTAPGLWTTSLGSRANRFASTCRGTYGTVAFSA
jgi:hypothetical protein